MLLFRKLLFLVSLSTFFAPTVFGYVRTELRSHELVLEGNKCDELKAAVTHISMWMSKMGWKSEAGEPECLEDDATAKVVVPIEPYLSPRVRELFLSKKAAEVNCMGSAFYWGGAVGVLGSVHPDDAMKALGDLVDAGTCVRVPPEDLALGDIGMVLQHYARSKKGQSEEKTVALHAFLYLAPDLVFEKEGSAEPFRFIDLNGATYDYRICDLFKWPRRSMHIDYYRCSPKA